MIHEQVNETPGQDLDLDRMPGHWLLARMGKKVLRPGGIELTTQMLDALQISPDDAVVELAPGLGVTARMAIAAQPASYVAIERDESAAAATSKYLRPGSDRCVRGSAHDTGLEDGSATVLYGEAMLTMQTAAQKKAILQEVFRVLKPGGRYGIHELALTPGELADEIKAEIMCELSSVIHVGARPLTMPEWRDALIHPGFEIVDGATAPMHLLEPARVLRDEGFPGMMRIAFNVARTPAARRRILAMRSVFRKYGKHLCAIMLVARKPAY
ncbi:MAG: hypothetical protein GMKNLPBB_02485 [Myxococcota bacterium]|nr:hypothetical protein [Myxococcota bacterium]